MKRREFIKLLGGAALGWPPAAYAQQDGGAAHRRAHGPGGGRSGSAGPRRGVPQSLQRLGWSDGRNVRIDSRWAAGDADRTRSYAAELIALAPDVILAPGSFTMGPLLQATRTVPIVFVHVPDPVGAGFVDSLARPGGNATGFILFEYGHERQMAGSAQADCAGRDASGGHSRSRPHLQERASSPQSRPWRRRWGWR